jgi:hypothetical protein
MTSEQIEQAYQTLRRMRELELTRSHLDAATALYDLACIASDVGCPTDAAAKMLRAIITEAIAVQIHQLTAELGDLGIGR